MIHYLLCVDDTDDLTKKTSTGKIAGLMAKEAEALGCTTQFGITRHQLLIHEDIEYTSHNSSMCFAAHTQEDCLETLWERSVSLLKSEMAQTSDPGLCLCSLDKLQNPEALVSFGKRAQNEVLTKEEAYTTAKALGGIRLQEFGGTGIGVIGALAGVGLRLSGSDGTIRGKTGIGELSVTKSAAEMARALGVSKIIKKDGTPLDDTAPVYIEDYAKLLLINHELVAACDETEPGRFAICRKPELYEGGRKNQNWLYGCQSFTPDTDPEEQLDTSKVCCNCLYRRWTVKGFECSK